MTRPSSPSELAVDMIQSWLQTLVTRWVEAPRPKTLAQMKQEAEGIARTWSATGSLRHWDALAEVWGKRPWPKDYPLSKLVGHVVREGWILVCGGQAPVELALRLRDPVFQWGATWSQTARDTEMLAWGAIPLVGPGTGQLPPNRALLAALAPLVSPGAIRQAYQAVIENDPVAPIIPGLIALNQLCPSTVPLACWMTAAVVHRVSLTRPLAEVLPLFADHLAADRPAVIAELDAQWDRHQGRYYTSEFWTLCDGALDGAPLPIQEAWLAKGAPLPQTYIQHQALLRQAQLAARPSPSSTTRTRPRA